jgi:hypothetical protein
MHEMTHEYSISCEFYKISDDLENILGTFKVLMGQLMHNDTLWLQFTFWLNKAIKSSGGQDSCAP